MADAPLTPQTPDELRECILSGRQLNREQHLAICDLWSQSLSTGSRVEQEKLALIEAGKAAIDGEYQRGILRSLGKLEIKLRFQEGEFTANEQAEMRAALIAIPDCLREERAERERLESELLATTQERDRLQQELITARRDRELAERNEAELRSQFLSAPVAYSATSANQCRPELGMHVWPDAHGCLCGASAGVNPG